MSKDSFYNQKFKCGKCKKVVFQYTWISQVDKNKHDDCGGKLTPTFEVVPETPGIIIASKHKKGRTMAERNKRRTDDFEKNTLPILGGSDRAYFEKKKKNRKK